MNVHANKIWFDGNDDIVVQGDTSSAANWIYGTAENWCGNSLQKSRGFSLRQSSIDKSRLFARNLCHQIRF